MNRLILVALLACLMTNTCQSSDIFIGEKHEPGFVQLKKDDDMFYWLFSSRNDVAKDPLVIWLTGGPGCSSEVAIFPIPSLNSSMSKSLEPSTSTAMGLTVMGLTTST